MRQLAALALAAGAAALRLPSPGEAVFSRRTAIGLGISAASTLSAQPSLAAAPPSTLAANPLCDPSITLVRSAAGQEMTLIGTAHISAESAVLVRNVIQTLKPDTVMIELDPSRAGKLMQRSKGVVASDTSGGSGNPTYGVGQLAGRLLRGDLAGATENGIGVGLSSLYKQMDSMGFQSGGEFLAAVEEADAIGATLLLGDRDARVTIRRLRDAVLEMVRNPPEPTGAQPPAALLEAAGGPNAELTRESVSTTLDVLKQRENVRALSEYLKTEVPPIYTALIGERDEYMAQSLLGSSGERIVAVVGLAHVDGIEAAILRANGGKIAAPKACRAV